jgi:hypothetical protein
MRGVRGKSEVMNYLEKASLLRRNEIGVGETLKKLIVLT